MSHVKNLKKHSTFGNPYEHLRFTYPDTWKKLTKMLEEEDPPPPGFTRLTDLERPKKRSDGKSTMRKSASEVLDGRRKRKVYSEEHIVHQMRVQKAFGDRNMFGGIAEGPQSFHNIVSDKTKVQLVYV
eukprot:TRINITY_DN23832_c0_g1_i1.p1 TRINITY_DN23832_c0_g1~~TRINITY_DN23832_c0_g1_i1.p1  ORF type:complete len:128 (+),score=27.47 TRINITY_DN23832_c0_g1_i1:81-464(+)